MGVIVILITINFLQNNKLTKSLLDYKMAIDFILQNAVFEKNEIIEVDGIKAIYNDGVYWMINNLDTEHYCNGDIIPNIKEADEWESLQVGAWCYYDNDEYYGKKYGKIYNGFAVNDERSLCPCGWRVASHEDWKNLSTSYGGDLFSHYSLKSDTGWSISGNNSSSFYALPTGYRPTFDGHEKEFDGLSGGVWWTSTRDFLFFLPKQNIGSLAFDIGPNNIYYSKNGWHVGQHVRCVKDIN